ncbi:MAG: pYEATS domain-containing protein [Pseudolabrys sp.]
MAASSAPQLTAHFETDDSGKPVFVNRGGRKHYNLVFEVENMPENVYAGTFELHESYYDPVRTLRPDRGKLELKTTSYGDYDLKVRLRTPDGEILVADNVVNALKRARETMPDNHDIDDAIAEIKKY